jgi:hypothetical protein
MKQIIVFALAACLASAAHAQSPESAKESPAPAAVTGDAAATVKLQEDVAADRKAVDDSRCLRQTGSRITSRDSKGRCAMQSGRAYSKEDIDRTGRTDLGDALRTLDPSIN